MKRSFTYHGGVYYTDGVREVLRYRMEKENCHDHRKSHHSKKRKIT